MACNRGPLVTPRAAAVMTALANLYGQAYNDGADVGLGGGFGRPGHWENRARWQASARGIFNVVRWLLPWPPADGPKTRVLDLGCGRGALVEELEGVGLEAFGVDLGDDVRTRRGVVGNAVALPFRADAFDVVVALDIVEHVPADAQAELWAEIKRVARGIVLLTVPARPPYGVWASDAGIRHHYVQVSPNEWRLRLEDEGLEVVVQGRDLEDYGPPFAWGEENYPFAVRRRR